MIVSDDRRRRWLHLPVETKARELEARLLLACVAAEAGFGAVIGVKGKVTKLADQLPRGAFLEKSVQLGSLPGVETRRHLGHIECCLDEEGLVYIDAEDYTAGRLARSVLDQLRLFFAWGDDQAQIVADYHPPIADRIRVTGNPRVDFWRGDLRALHAGPADAIRAEHGRFVLFTTAFAMVNNSRGEQYFVDSLRSNGRMDTQEGAERSAGYIAHSRCLFEWMLRAVSQLAAQRPGLPIVVRPHPSEDIGEWERVTEHLDNVTVCREGPVTPWLLAAEAVVHNNSTTGLEATLLGRPTIAFVPVVDPRHDQNLPNAVSHQAPTIDELTRLVDRVWAGDAIASSAASRAALDHHLASLDGPLAADRLVRELQLIDLPESRLDGGLARRLGAGVRLVPRRLSRWVPGRPRALPAAQITKPRTDRSEKFPATPVDEVEAMIQRFRDVTGRFDGVRSEELTSRVYLVLPADG